MSEQAIASTAGPPANMPWAGPVLFTIVAVAVMVFFWWFLGNRPVQDDSAALVAERIRPIGQLRIATVGSKEVPVAEVQVDGETVYQAACAACHSAGIAGAPRLGDTVVWAERIASGVDVLYASAINGLQGTAGVMPPRGGNAALSDLEVRGAVDYMMSQMK
ncbi:MAG: c-type cytochrome [Arenicellales bacterium]|nr:c-type cytochrome [Arenicellales bacterium]MDP6393762.1 c-type cytochrome [Arenicellales bacterium]